MYHCSCCQRQLPYHKAYLKHMRRFHKSNPGLRVTCGVAGCPRIFTKISSLTSHISRCHASKGIANESAEVEEQETEVQVAEILPDEPDNEENPQDNQEHDKALHELAESCFILDLRANSNASQSLIKNVISYVQDIVKNKVESYSAVVAQNLSTHGLNLTDYMDVDKEINDASAVFQNLETDYLQQKVFKTKFCYTEAKSVELGRNIVQGAAGETGVGRRASIVVDTMMFVSIVETLKNLLSNQNFTSLLNNENSDSSEDKEYLESFQDGSIKKNKQYFKDHPNTLQIILYFDEVTLNDTVSSRPHKLGMFYFILGNLPPQYRSSLKVINLVAVVKSTHIQRYGINQIMQPIVDDLKSLEAGVPGPNGTLHGVLVAFIGDNLGCHLVGGFKEGFTAKRCCRYCFAPLESIRTEIKEDPSILRTPWQYNQQVAELDAAATQKEREEKSTQFGINRKSVLCEMEEFHVVDGVPPDAMHDLLEGAFPITIKYLLEHFCMSENKVMVLSEFNDRVRQFDYGYSEERPSEIKPQHLNENGKLHQTASQMWSLALVIPFVLGSFISTESEEWRNFLQLLEITSIVLAHKISPGMIEYLYLVIQEYLSSFQSLYRHLIPKQHFLTHYPSYILKYGPLNQFWTMRMEAKHKYFKDVMRNIRNFKNTPFSLTMQHQLYQAFVLHGSVKAHIEGMGKVTKTVSSVCNFGHLIPDAWNEFYTLSWVIIEGVRYASKKCCVAVGFENDLPLFAFVDTLVQHDESIYFVCKTVKTVEHTTHLNAYEVLVRPEYSPRLYTEKDFVAPSVFHVHAHKGQRYIVTKRCIGDLH